MKLNKNITNSYPVEGSLAIIVSEIDDMVIITRKAWCLVSEEIKLENLIERFTLVFYRNLICGILERKRSDFRCARMRRAISSLERETMNVGPI